MDRPKLPNYIYNGLPKLDTFTIINKRITLSFLMNIGLTIMFSGITLTHLNTCLITSLNLPENRMLHTSSYSLGFVIIQIPAAWCSLKFSALKSFGRSILAYSILMFIIALLGSVDYGFLILLKFFEGVVSGITIVVAHAAWKNWTPSVERSTLITFALTGCHLGHLFGMLMSKYCSELPFIVLLLGILGSIGIIWWFVWESMVYEAPNKHRTITEKEYNQIHPTIREEIRPTENVPCKQIIFSVPFFVLVIVTILSSWNARFYIYFKENIFNTSMFISSIKLSTLPLSGYLADIFVQSTLLTDVFIISIIKLITLPLSGYLADVLVRNDSLTITDVRKFYISGVFVMEAIYFLFSNILFFGLVSWFYYASFFMQILYNMALTAAIINAVDIAPSHSGVTIAITNMISCILHEISFKIEFYLREMNWLDMVNYMSVIAHLIGGVTYGIYGSANPITVKK